VSAIRPVLDRGEGSRLTWLLERQLLKEEPMGKPVGSPYSWQAMHSGKVLDVANASSDNGVQIIQWDWHGGSNQRWRRLPYTVRIDDSQ
jgi:hypothetical protein